MKKEQAFRKLSQDLPHLVRIDKATHVRLKEMKKMNGKSMAQIVIDLVTHAYNGEERKVEGV